MEERRHSLLFLFSLGTIHQTADAHHGGEYDQVPHAAHPMAEYGGQNHKDAAADGKNGQDEPAQNGLILFLSHSSHKEKSAQNKEKVNG